MKWCFFTRFLPLNRLKKTTKPLLDRKTSYELNLLLFNVTQCLGDDALVEKWGRIKDNQIAFWIVHLTSSHEVSRDPDPIFFSCLPFIRFAVCVRLSFEGEIMVIKRGCWLENQSWVHLIRFTVSISVSLPLVSSFLKRILASKKKLVSWVCVPPSFAANFPFFSHQAKPVSLFSSQIFLLWQEKTILIKEVIERELESLFQRESLRHSKSWLICHVFGVEWKGTESKGSPNLCSRRKKREIFIFAWKESFGRLSLSVKSESECYIT